MAGSIRFGVAIHTGDGDPAVIRRSMAMGVTATTALATAAGVTTEAFTTAGAGAARTRASARIREAICIRPARAWAHRTLLRRRPMGLLPIRRTRVRATWWS